MKEEKEDNVITYKEVFLAAIAGLSADGGQSVDDTIEYAKEIAEGVMTSNGGDTDQHYVLVSDLRNS